MCTQYGKPWNQFLSSTESLYPFPKLLVGDDESCCKAVCNRYYVVIGTACQSAANVVFVEFISEFGDLPSIVGEPDDEMSAVSYVSYCTVVYRILWLMHYCVCALCRMEGRYLYRQMESRHISTPLITVTSVQLVRRRQMLVLTEDFALWLMVILTFAMCW